MGSLSSFLVTPQHILQEEMWLSHNNTLQMQDREYGIKPTHESRVYLGIWEKVKGLKYWSLKASVTGCPVLGLLRVMCSKFNWEMSQVAMTLRKISNAEAWNSSHMWWVLSRCAKLQMQRTTLSQPSQFPCLCHMHPKMARECTSPLIFARNLSEFIDAERTCVNSGKIVH